MLIKLESGLPVQCTCLMPHTQKGEGLASLSSLLASLLQGEGLAVHSWRQLACRLSISHMQDTQALVVASMGLTFQGLQSPISGQKVAKPSIAKPSFHMTVARCSPGLPGVGGKSCAPAEVASRKHNMCSMPCNKMLSVAAEVSTQCDLMPGV